MGFLDERVSNNKEKVAEMEKIEKLILQMQNNVNVNVKINQQGEKIEELKKKIEVMQARQATSSEISDRDVAIKDAIMGNNVWILGIGILMIICTVWLDWNTVEEDSSHQIQRMIEQNYIDTKNVWRQGDTMLYNQKNGTYLTVEEYEKMRADQHRQAQ